MLSRIVCPWLSPAPAACRVAPGLPGWRCVVGSPWRAHIPGLRWQHAAWLLNAEVREARPLNVELPGETLAVDQVFHITLVDRREALLYIEFQRRSSRAPMRWRVLEYMVRLTVNYRLELLSVVIYVGCQRLSPEGDSLSLISGEVC